MGVAAQADEMQVAAGATWPAPQYSVGAGQPPVAVLHWDLRHDCCRGGLVIVDGLHGTCREGETYSTLRCLAEPLGVGSSGGRQDGGDGCGLHGEGWMG